MRNSTYYGWLKWPFLVVRDFCKFCSLLETKTRLILHWNILQLFTSIFSSIIFHLQNSFSSVFSMLNHLPFSLFLLIMDRHIHFPTIFLLIHLQFVVFWCDEGGGGSKNTKNHLISYMDDPLCQKTLPKKTWISKTSQRKYRQPWSLK